LPAHQPKTILRHDTIGALNMSGKRFDLKSIMTLATATLVLTLAAPVAGLADARLADEPLPRPVIKTEDCLNVNSSRWGWNGEQSCFISVYQYHGESEFLTRTSRDYGGAAVSWSRGDVANKTLRCDSYQRKYVRSTRGYTYERKRYDITFLTEDQIPAEASGENLSDVTAHLYTRGWSVGGFGKLNVGTLINFNRGGFSTENGYIFIDEFTRESNVLYRIDSFAHCFYRDEDTPMRPSGYCVDFDGDGVGWNGNENCEVTTVDPDCDYSQADKGSNFGWGYNPVTGQSCPPAENIPSPYEPVDECRRNGPDGWGWNEARQQSCRVDG